MVALVELVSPSNKERPESRQIFTAKCEALLRQGVSVAIVDAVTDKNFNLYAEMLELVGQRDTTLSPERPATYAAACRWIPRERKSVLESWLHVLRVGQAWPTLLIWLAENFAVPLNREVFLRRNLPRAAHRIRTPNITRVHSRKDRPRECESDRPSLAQRVKLDVLKKPPVGSPCQLAEKDDRSASS